MLRRLRLGWESVRSEVERELEIEEIRRSAKEAAERADAVRKAANAEMHSAHASVNETVAEIANTTEPVQGNATSTELRDGH
jgi:sec-independent protein translocase protein TatB